MVTESLTWLREKDVLTEHSAIVLPVIFRKSGLPPAVEVKRRRVMSDANLFPAFILGSSSYICLSTFFLPISNNQVPIAKGLRTETQKWKNIYVISISLTLNIAYETWLSQQK